MIIFESDEPITTQALEVKLAREWCPTCRQGAAILVYKIHVPRWAEPPPHGLLIICDRCKAVATLSISYPMSGGVEMTIRWGKDRQHEDPAVQGE